MKKRKGMDRRLMGVTALNSFALHNSNSRGLMYGSHLSQLVSLINSESKYILSGLELEFGKANMFSKVPENSIILDVLVYMDPFEVEDNDDDEPTMVDIIYYNITEEVVDFVKVKKYEKYDKKFGFQHTYTDELRNLDKNKNRPIRDEIKLTTTNSEVSDGEYGFGVTLALASITDATVSEDAQVISESAAHKLAYYTYETTRFSFGGDTVPLNVHGDKDDYKILKDVGEDIGDSGILLATRSVSNQDYFPALFSYKSLREFDVTFDKVWALTYPVGKIVDIEVIHSPKNSKYTMYEKSYEQMDAYARAQQEHRNLFIERANYWIDQYNTHAGQDLHPELIRAMKISSDLTKNTYKQDTLDEYTVEVTVRYLNVPTLKHKLTTMHGNKGIVSEVRPDNQMPIDANGIVAEIITNPGSTVHRMNLGSKYEGVMTTATYLVDRYVKDTINSSSIEKEYIRLHKYVVGFVKCFGNDQYRMLSKLSDSEKKIFIRSIYRDKLQILLPLDNEIDHVAVHNNLLSSIYYPKDDNFFVYKDGKHIPSHEKGMFEMTYVFLLNKTGETGLSVASAKLNHFGLPAAPNPELKTRMGYNGAPTKILSETETRLLLATVGQIPVIELRNRSLSQDSHYTIYNTILNHATPGNIPDVIDRRLHPIKTDTVQNIYSAILNASGVRLKAVKKGD